MKKIISIVVAIVLVICLTWIVYPHLFKRSYIENQLNMAMPQSAEIVDYAVVKREIFAKISCNEQDYEYFHQLFYERDVIFNPVSEKDLELYYLDLILEEQQKYGKHYIYEEFDQINIYSVTISSMPQMSVVLILNDGVCELFIIQ